MERRAMLTQAEGRAKLFRSATFMAYIQPVNALQDHLFTIDGRPAFFHMCTRGAGKLSNGQIAALVPRIRVCVTVSRLRCVL